MAIDLGLTQRVKILQCPKCKQTIDTSARLCPFCSTSIDPAEAEAAAEVMDKVNQGCSDASYLRTMAWTMWACVALGFVPFVSIIGVVGSWFLLFAVPVMSIRWWVKFGAVSADDPEFTSAKRSVMLTVGIWALFLVLFIALRVR